MPAFFCVPLGELSDSQDLCLDGDVLLRHRVKADDLALVHQLPLVRVVGQEAVGEAASLTQLYLVAADDSHARVRLKLDRHRVGERRLRQRFDCGLDDVLLAQACAQAFVEQELFIRLMDGRAEELLFDDDDGATFGGGCGECGECGELFLFSRHICFVCC